VGGPRNKRIGWYRAIDPGELGEGQVRRVACGAEEICLTRFEGRITAMGNACPHQGGPLGEGQIVDGHLRCPRHGWDFHPHTGRARFGYDPGSPVFASEIREGGLWVGVPEETPGEDSAADVLARALARWSFRSVFAVADPVDSALADAMRREEAGGHLRCHEVQHPRAAALAAMAYASLSGRPAGCVALSGEWDSDQIFQSLIQDSVRRGPVVAVTGSSAVSAPLGPLAEAVDRACQAAIAGKRTVYVGLTAEPTDSSPLSGAEGGDPATPSATASNDPDPAWAALRAAIARRAPRDPILVTDRDPLPNALGAWAATQGDDPALRGRKVVVISDATSYEAHKAELATAARYGMNITSVVLCGAEAGGGGGSPAEGLSAYAELCGARSVVVVDARDLDFALVDALSFRGPSLVEVACDPVIR
jgi:nitrite reductase/ring-hydroxylating ferredoxin subunit/thiamine pyrophosphate-dependent acetolactate synthase large subunit-like protein